jgi:hypothetical protein
MKTEILTLAIEAKGEVISSNFPAFAGMVRARLGEINRELATDEDFDQADSDAKAIANAEAALKEAKEKALADAEQLHHLFEQIDGLSGDLAKARLDLTKQITKRKEEVKAELVDEALAGFDIDPAMARREFTKAIAEAMKGKRTVETMRQAATVYVTIRRATIHKSRAAIESFEAAHGAELTMDKRELELKTPDSVDAELRRRFEAKKAAEEAARLRAEVAAAKAEADKANALREEAAKPAAPPAAPKVEIQAPAIEGEAITADEEWGAFKAAAILAFAELKAARGKLTHSKNTAKAQGLANGFNAVWKEWA